MDHLPCPFGTKLTEEDDIPYAASNDYHGVPFLEYAKTNNAYQAALDSADALAVALHKPKLEISELQRFLQTWLFFGLLQETLGEIFSQHDFVRATSSKVVISTKKLPEKLKEWTSGQNLTQKHLRHLDQCLYMVFIALLATPGNFDAKLKVGIGATAETIGAALILGAKAMDISINFLITSCSWGSLDDPNLRIAEMRNLRGWCPAQASFTLAKYHSLQSKIYLSRIAKPYNRESHNACSLEVCRALQIDPSTYTSLHRHPGICRDVKTNQEEVFKVLKRGKNALLDLRLNLTFDEISVDVVAAQPDSWYIAISHVWADGLGNTRENSLPQCQLRRIYDLLTSFCTEEFIERTQRRPYLWLDTLCCPVDPEYKLLALAKMPEVYREASQVLVLDSSLTEIDCRHLQPIEVMSRVFSSGWIFRLWTLNEANLTSKLWIQFRDGVIELGHIHIGLSLMTEPETYHFTSELDSEYYQLQFHSFGQARNPLWLVTQALRCRSVSKVSDEPICLGYLLRIDTNAITGKERLSVIQRLIPFIPLLGFLRPSANQKDKITLRDERMARLWESTAKGQLAIPKALIYHVGDRLAKPGLRWAPSTLLNIEDTSHFLSLTEADDALPSAHGLVLSSAAFSVSVPERVDGILSPFPTASFMPDLLKRDEHHWLTISSTTRQKKYPLGCDHMALYDIMNEAGEGVEFEILLSEAMNPSQESHERLNCLLIAKTTTESQNPDPEIKNVRFFRQGWISNHNRSVCDFINLVLRQAQALQSDSITQEIREFNKYGDQDQRYLDAFKRLQGKAELVVNQLEAELDATGKYLPGSGVGFGFNRRKAIFSLLSRFYRNRYFVKGQDFPVTQKYCVD